MFCICIQMQSLSSHPHINCSITLIEEVGYIIFFFYASETKIYYDAFSTNIN